MYALAVTIHVKPENIDEFVPAMLENARGTRTEPGNLRYDVLQGEDDPGRFLIYEVYADKEALAAHQQSPHYLKWRDTVKDWMAQPRQGQRYLTQFFD